MKRRKALLLLLCIVALPGCGRKEPGGERVLTPEEAGTVKPVQEQDVETITQEFDFYSDDEHIFYFNFPEIYDLNGKSYALSKDIQYETIGTREVVEVAAPMNVEELKEIPDTYAYEAATGNTYELQNEQVYIKRQGAVKIPVIEEVYYEDQVGRPAVPSRKDIVYYDKEAGEDRKVSGTLRDLTETKTGHWADMLAIDGVFSAPSASVEVFELKGAPNVTVPQTAASPVWAGYETDILTSLGLDGRYYRIKSAAWDGDPYEKDGLVMRDALFLGDAFVSDYRAVYEGQREANGYETTVYYRADAEDVDAPEEDVTTVYHIKSVVTYYLVENS